MSNHALFEGLVYDEDENLLEVTRIGNEAFYIVNDNGFLRHVKAEEVDRQVLSFFLEQLEGNKDIAVQQALTMLGKDDLFTKAAVDAQLSNVDMEQIIAQGIPAQAREMLGMLGFRITINLHGQVTDIKQPSAPDQGY
ncbi:MAG: hypothetical protein R3293_02950 [Candidatus Promineifilaceae bacterium]|nr:hypothetical protein [Candidatus Promineifilaceae bacterium]